MQASKSAKTTTKKKSSGQPKSVQDSTSRDLRADPKSAGGENPTDLDALISGINGKRFDLTTRLHVATSQKWVNYNKIVSKMLYILFDFSGYEFIGIDRSAVEQAFTILKRDN